MWDMGKKTKMEQGIEMRIFLFLSLFFFSDFNLPLGIPALHESLDHATGKVLLNPKASRLCTRMSFFEAFMFKKPMTPLLMVDTSGSQSSPNLLFLKEKKSRKLFIYLLYLYMTVTLQFPLTKEFLPLVNCHLHVCQGIISTRTIYF